MKSFIFSSLMVQEKCINRFRISEKFSFFEIAKLQKQSSFLKSFLSFMIHLASEKENIKNDGN